MTVVIPTYGREQVLVQTVELVLEQSPGEVLVVDQTPRHERKTEEALNRLASTETIRHLKLEKPSIPHAMNTGLLAAQSETVLFLDDDVIPGEGLLEAHSAVHAARPEVWVVIGQILQPGENPEPACPGTAFRFNSNQSCYIASAMAGNMSVRKSLALEVGGFDEHFAGTAYMFETEFAERIGAAGGKVFFEPRAGIRHLRSPEGGTRKDGSHLNRPSPLHTVGAHYYFQLHRSDANPEWRSLLRVFRSVRTRHHLARPWDIPATLLAEIRGYLSARQLAAKGQALSTRNCR